LEPQSSVRKNTRKTAAEETSLPVEIARAVFGILPALADHRDLYAVWQFLAQLSERSVGLIKGQVDGVSAHGRGCAPKRPINNR
jgi:hypothetical protein